MKVLNNIVVNDIRMFLTDQTISIGRLHSLEKYLATEVGGLVYNAKTLMKDIEKIVKEVSPKKYNLEVLDIILNGLSVTYEYDSLFYNLNKDKQEKFNILYNELFTKKDKIIRLPEVYSILINGGLSISFIAEMLITDAKDLQNLDEKNLDNLRKWDYIYNTYFKHSLDNPTLAAIIDNIYPCISDHKKFLDEPLSKEANDALYGMLIAYKILPVRTSGDSNDIQNK